MKRTNKNRQAEYLQTGKSEKNRCPCSKVCNRLRA